MDSAKAKQVAQVFDLYVGILSHDKGGGNLGDQPDSDAQIPIVIDQAHADQYSNGRNKGNLVGLDVDSWQQCHQERHIDRQATDKRVGDLCCFLWQGLSVRPNLTAHGI